MSRKFFLILGFGAGYVLGSRAGRQRYEQIKRLAGKVWNSKKVQGALGQAESFAKEKAPELTTKLEQGARFVVSVVSGGPQEGAVTARPKAAASKSTTRKTAAKPAAKSTTAKSATAKSATKPRSSTTASRSKAAGSAESGS